MKTFFLWLTIQCIFARVLIGMTLGLWAELKVPAEYLGYFVFPAAIICVAEVIASAVVVYPLIDPSNNYRR